MADIINDITNDISMQDTHPHGGTDAVGILALTPLFSFSFEETYWNVGLQEELYYVITFSPFNLCRKA